MSRRIASSVAARVAARRASSSISGGAIGGYLSAPSAGAAAAAAPAVCAGAGAGASAHHHVNPSPPLAACRQPITRGYGSTADLSSVGGSSAHPSSTRLSRRLCRWRPQLPGGGATSSSVISRRAIGSTAPLPKSAEPKPAAEGGEAEPKAVAAEDDGGDPCPPWQNPLHHNNPEFSKVLAEDFEPGEEVPVVPLPPFEDGDDDSNKVIAPPHIHDIADEIVRLSMLEVKELVDRVGDHFGFDDDAGFGDDGGGDGDGAAEEEAVVEKTVFDLKLTGFDAKTKIKVIKEVRAITGAGLKEAKELVEGAPTVIKKDIKKEEAEELKVKLEALGATIEIV